MNWSRYKLIVISGAATLVISAGLIFWILSSTSASRELEQSVRTLRQQQTRLTSADLYPSEANLEALQEEQQNVRLRRDEILTVIREGQISPQPVSRSVFGDYVNDVVPQLRNAAAAATKGGAKGVLLRDPDFGLTEFLEGTLPSQRRINELVVEIETLKHLSTLLFDAGISELISISVVSEDAAQAETAGRRPRTASPLNSARSRRRDQAPSSASEDDTEEGRVIAERERLFEELTFTLEFNAYEDFFWEVLNRILADPNQIVVSSITVTNSNTLLWPDYLQNPSSAGESRSARRERRETSRRPTPENDLLSMLGGRESTAQEVPEEEAKQAGLPERQQNLVGGDLLNVILRLNVYRIKPDEAMTTQPEGA
jgi:hypothetical protein